MRTHRILLVLLIALAPLGAPRADVRVVVGPTPIPHGGARSAKDITVINEKLAFALAVTRLSFRRSAEQGDNQNCDHPGTESGPDTEASSMPGTGDHPGA